MPKSAPKEVSRSKDEGKPSHYKRNLQLDSFSSQNSKSIPIEETLEDALVDLYLSVKIRSNDEINVYNEDTLAAERVKLKEIDPFTILEYIKASIEVLMGMKDDQNKPRPDELSQLDSERAGSLQSQYESQLQKYEAEVRNHIKIEQQLKLHIECVQDKLDDTEKLLKKYAAERDDIRDTKQELARSKELVKQRDAQIEGLKRQMASQKQYGLQMATRLQELEDQELEREHSPNRDGTRTKNKYEQRPKHQSKGQPSMSTSLTNQTIQMLNLQSSSERIQAHSSKSKVNPLLVPPNLRVSEKQSLQYSQTGREFKNKSALGIVGAEPSRIQVNRSPDRGQNMSALSSYNLQGDNSMYLGKQPNPYSQTTNFPKKGTDKKSQKQTIESLIHNNSYQSVQQQHSRTKSTISKQQIYPVKISDNQLLLKAAVAQNAVHFQSQQHPLANTSMRALNNGSHLDTFEPRHSDSHQTDQLRPQHFEAGQNNIISGTYINSSIIVHNPGNQILVPSSVKPKNILKKHKSNSQTTRPAQNQSAQDTHARANSYHAKADRASFSSTQHGSALLDSLQQQKESSQKQKKTTLKQPSKGLTPSKLPYEPVAILNNGLSQSVNKQNIITYSATIPKNNNPEKKRQYDH